MSLSHFGQTEVAANGQTVTAFARVVDSNLIAVSVKELKGKTRYYCNEHKAILPIGGQCPFEHSLPAIGVGVTTRDIASAVPNS